MSDVGEDCARDLGGVHKVRIEAEVVDPAGATAGLFPVRMTWLPAAARAIIPATNPGWRVGAVSGHTTQPAFTAPNDCSSNTTQGVEAACATAAMTVDFPDLDGPWTRTARPPGTPPKTGGR